MNLFSNRNIQKTLPPLMSAGVMTFAVLLSVTSSAGIQGSGFRSLSVIGSVTDTVHPGSGILVIGGHPYNTSQASIQIDGHAGTQAQVNQGDVVSLLASDPPDGGTPTASSIAVTGSVRGKVSNVDAPAGTLFVLGQTVHVTSQTVFGGALRASGLSGLQSGAAVEVGGFANSAGEVVATRIDPRGQSYVARVVGNIQSLDPTQHTFYINALKIDYGTAGPDTVLAEGAPVTVQGVNFAADGALVANQVRSAAPQAGQPGSIGRVQGLITRFPSSRYFEVDGQRVLVNSQTQLTLPAPLALDAAVEVEGTFDTSGVLVASSVQTSR